MVQQGRALRTIRGDQVIGSRRCAHGLHGAHGDHVGIIAWYRDSAIAIVTVRVVTTIVAGRHHHDDSCFPSLLRCLTQRIQGVALEDASTERQVDDPDVVQVLQSDRLIDARDHRAVGGRSVLVQHAQVNDVGIGGDAAEGDIAVPARGAASVARDDGGDVRAVTV